MRKQKRLDISFIFILAALLVSIYAIQYHYQALDRQEKIAEQAVPEPEDLVDYQGPVEHIFFHSLIVYPEKAFHSGEARGFDDYYVTTGEFRKIIQSLYERGYVLVRPDQVYESTTNEGRVMIRRRELKLRRGRKPLIISFDDTNYYRKFSLAGINSLIILTNERIATLARDSQDKLVLSYDSEHITIIDNFIADHPDFSYRGARGIIGVTGYEGILGYRVTSNYPHYKEEREKALEVVSALRQRGWIFASHSFTHWHLEQVPVYRLKYDFMRWNEEIRPLLGDLDIYLYPFGEGPQSEKNARVAHYTDNKFRLLYSVSSDSWEKIYPELNLVIAGRRQVDGIAFRHHTEGMRDLFNVEDVIDLAARGIFSTRYAAIARLTNKNLALLSVSNTEPEITLY